MAILTISRGQRTEHTIVPDGHLMRLRNFSLGYRAVERALQWIAEHPDAEPDDIRGVALDALGIMETAAEDIA